jgi:hypothetical protein
VAANPQNAEDTYSASWMHGGCGVLANSPVGAIKTPATTAGWLNDVPSGRHPHQTNVKNPPSLTVTIKK